MARGWSSWLGRNGCNAFSIGIELDNAGELKRQGGEWRAWSGGTIDAKEVVEAEHRDGGGITGWQGYTEAQLKVALEVSIALRGAYPSITDVVGHEDIAPHRKRDPGPAFSMESFKAAVLGRLGDAAVACRTTNCLNVRTGRGVGFPTVPLSPLPAGAMVEVDSAAGAWRRIRAELSDGRALAGWVHSQYLVV